MRKSVISLVAAACLLGLAAPPGALAEDAAPAAAAAPEVDAELLAALKKEGTTVYFSSCQGCHAAGGAGEAGPKLASNSNLENTKEVLRQVLHGGSYMPPMNTLSDREIAAVVTYIRTSWGNKYGPVTEQEVAAAR